MTPTHRNLALPLSVRSEAASKIISDLIDGKSEAELVRLYDDTNHHKGVIEIAGREHRLSDTIKAENYRLHVIRQNQPSVTAEEAMAQVERINKRSNESFERYMESLA